MPQAPVGVITPVKATTNREFVADPVSGGSRQQDGGGVEEKSRGKRGHSPRSNVMLDQMEESRKFPRKERGPGQE